MSQRAEFWYVWTVSHYRRPSRTSQKRRLKAEPSYYRSTSTWSFSGFLDTWTSLATKQWLRNRRNISTSLSVRCSELCEQIDPWHVRTALVYKNINLAKDQAGVKSRKDAMFPTQVRSGHCLSFKAYHHLFNSAVDPTCPRCREGPHTLEHWFLECVGTESTWWDIFGDVKQSLKVPTDQPGMAVLMSQCIL